MTCLPFPYRLPPKPSRTRGNPMLRRYVTTGIALAVGALASTGAFAQETTKIGLVLPLTGGLAAVGKQVQAGAKLYVDKNGATVGGKKIELIVKDDAGVPDNSKRLAQELIVNDKVAVIGSALTPSAMAVGPLSTQSKTANVVMVSGTSGVINPGNPYMVRTSFTLGQQSGIIAEWAAKNGAKKVVIVQSDWAPGAEATAVFTEAFTRAGRNLRQAVRRARARQGRDQAHRPRRHRRRQRPSRHGRRHAGRGDRRHLFDPAQFAGQQRICRRLREGEQLPPELHLARRLRRHAPDLRGAQDHRRQDR